MRPLAFASNSIPERRRGGQPIHPALLTRHKGQPPTATAENPTSCPLLSFSAAALHDVPLLVPLSIQEDLGSILLPPFRFVCRQFTPTQSSPAACSSRHKPPD